MSNTDNKISKMLTQDKRTALKTALNDARFDAAHENDSWEYYKLDYSANQDYSEISFSGEPVEIELEYKTVFVEKDNSEEAVTKSWLETRLVSFLTDITKHFGGSKEEETAIPVIKQFDDVKHTTVEHLYVAPMTPDGIGDAYPEEDLEPMLISFNKAIEEGRMQSGLFHKHRTNKFEVVKAWAAEEDCLMGEVEVKKGEPLVEINYLSEELYELRKSGEVMGPSIGARCTEIIEIDENGVEKSLGEGEVTIGKGNPLDTIKSEPKIKRILKGINFDWPNPELTLTDPSAGGACSLKNDIIIEKSMKPLNETQKAILEEIGEEFTPIAKQLNEGEEVDNTGVNKTETEGTDMSVEKDQEIAELKKQLRKVDVEKAFAKYELGDAAEALIDFAADVEDFSAITKALDVLVAASEVAVEKAKEEVAPQNPVEKALSEEKAEGGEPEVEVEKSLAEKVKEKTQALKGIK